MDDHPLAALLTMVTDRVESADVPDTNGTARIWSFTPPADAKQWYGAQTPETQQWLDALQTKWRRETEEAYYQLVLAKMQRDPLYPVMRRKLRRTVKVLHERGEPRP